jgi:hypothetical protein
VNKKRLKATQAFTDSETIAALKSAVEDLVSRPRRKKPEELEGIIAEAKTLAHDWKDPKDGRPFFGDTALDTNVLLAALVVALRPYYERLEPILRLAPNEFEDATFVAGRRRLEEVAAYIAAHGIAGVPKPTAKQKHEVKRRFSFPNRFRSIEYEFGGAGEAERRKRLAALPPLPPLDLVTLAGHQEPRTLTNEPTCLDDIFAGQTVNMQRLEELFGTYRHCLSAILRGSHKPPYNYLDVVKIMHALLSEPRKRRKKATAGRPPRKAWLNDADLRARVLKAIEARIATIAAAFRESNPDIAQRWQKEVASRFLAVVRQHLPDSGKK